MEEHMIILHAEDDIGHAQLVQHALKQKGIMNEIIHFNDGEEILNFSYSES